MKLTINIIISIGICCSLGLYSGGLFSWVLIVLFILCCLVTSIMLTVWVKGSFKERIKKTMPYAFPLNILTFLAGYVYETIKVL
jgi:hypothetical protein